MVNYKEVALELLTNWNEFISGNYRKQLHENQYFSGILNYSNGLEVLIQAVVL